MIMSHDRTSFIVLGNGESLKKALITYILEKDLERVTRKSGPNNTVIYEHDRCEISCTPDMNTAHKDLKDLFPINKHPDMCLLVVQDEFSTKEVWKQIQNLSETTGKPTEDFTVVPVGCENNYVLKYYNMGQSLGRKSKHADNRHETQTDERSTEHPESNSSTGGRCSKEHATDPMKSLKRKLDGTTVNLVLLGLCGTGKSSCGNTILQQQQHFMSKSSSEANTTECQAAETQIHSTCVRVIDTPADIFDDETDESLRNKHVAKCKELCQSEPRVYLLVIEIGRFTDGERDILTKLEDAFGREARKRTIILFSRGENLRHDETDMKTFLNNLQTDLKKIIEECGERFVVFENKKSKDSYPRQVEELMQTVEKVLAENQK